MKLHLNKNFIFCMLMTWVTVSLYANDLENQNQFVHSQAAVKPSTHYNKTPPHASHSKSTKFSSYKVWAGVATVVATVGLTAAAAALYVMSRNSHEYMPPNPQPTTNTGELIVDIPHQTNPQPTANAEEPIVYIPDQNQEIKNQEIINSLWGINQEEVNQNVPVENPPSDDLQPELQTEIMDPGHPNFQWFRTTNHGEESQSELYNRMFFAEVKPWNLTKLTSEQRAGWIQFFKSLDEMSHCDVKSLEEKVKKGMETQFKDFQASEKDAEQIVEQIKQEIDTEKKEGQSIKKISTFLGYTKDKNLTGQFVGQIPLGVIVYGPFRNRSLYLAEENVALLFGVDKERLNLRDDYTCTKKGSFLGIAAIEAKIIHALGEKLDSQSLATLGRFIALVRQLLCGRTVYIPTPIHRFMRYGQGAVESDQYDPEEKENYEIYTSCMSLPGYPEAYKKVLEIMACVPGYEAAIESRRISHILGG